VKSSIFSLNSLSILLPSNSPSIFFLSPNPFPSLSRSDEGYGDRKEGEGGEDGEAGRGVEVSSRREIGGGVDGVGGLGGNGVCLSRSDEGYGDGKGREDGEDGRGVGVSSRREIGGGMDGVVYKTGEISFKENVSFRDSRSISIEITFSVRFMRSSFFTIPSSTPPLFSTSFSPPLLPSLVLKLSLLF
jgi:hypothetical protein